jgi:hypothetical protein
LAAQDGPVDHIGTLLKAHLRADLAAKDWAAACQHEGGADSGWSAKGTSPTGVKIGTRALCCDWAGGSTKLVSRPGACRLEQIISYI